MLRLLGAAVILAEALRRAEPTQHLLWQRCYHMDFEGAPLFRGPLITNMYVLI